ncbi:class I SAM-dependent methyltransferase [Candidatus Kuenenbacteria bacterium]|nr:class I SAM-dependent methyltransferase [Candidatus Kuenenbacteria bacterium]
MKVLFNKIKKNLQEKGWKKTLKIARVVLGTVLTSEKKKMRQLEKYINQHNRTYEKITGLATSLNNGTHPKHEIVNYSQFFLDNIDENDKILDAGSGTGLVAYKIAEKAKYVLGVDFNKKSIEEAQKKYQRSNLKFIVADLNEYRPEEKFDKIILSNVLEHICDRKRLLEALKNVAPIILLRVPLITRDWLAAYKKAKGFEYKLDPTHELEYTEAEIKKEIEATGWVIKSFQVNWGEWWGIIKRQYVDSQD